LLPLKHEQQKQVEMSGKYVPILVKISPDMDLDALSLLIDQLLTLKIDGVIATNTTIARDNLLPEKYTEQEGGLSGRPLFQESCYRVKKIYEQAGDNLPIIAVGGIFSAQDALDKFKAGAKLVQLYSGFIYQGPRLIRDIVLETEKL
jgi:dihydroorotate dehydrogenase